MITASVEFQSLIGRLKTLGFGAGAWARAAQFQSLIGRLKTPAHELRACRALLFQSLIGRLKTRTRD